MMLIRNPDKRPSCKELLDHHLIKDNMDVMEQSVCQISEDSVEKKSNNINLLNTIKLNLYHKIYN